MQIKHKLSVALALALGSTLAVTSPASAQQAGTTLLDASKTAGTYWQHITTYDWNLTKSVSNTSITLDKGQSTTLTYDLAVKRNVASETDVLGVKGEVCVTNGGAVATENLMIVDNIQYKTDGPFDTIHSSNLDLSANPVLDPGETACYPYDIKFESAGAGQYRNEALITITNHSGWLPGGNNCEGSETCNFGTQVRTSFDLPASPELLYVDESANLADQLTCPTGMTCTLNPNVNTWEVSGDTNLEYTVTVTNNSAQCESTLNMPNVATLTSTDTGSTWNSQALVTILTGACPVDPEEDPQSCTYTIGYWKTHAGFGPQQDMVSALLAQTLGNQNSPKTLVVSNAKMAVDVLNMKTYGKPDNGITKLYAQLLASKLNLASGADNTAVAEAISSADLFLATHNWQDWKTLSVAEKTEVLSLASLFDSFNNGEIGPGHCD